MGGLDGAVVDVDWVVVVLCCDDWGIVDASLSSPVELAKESCEPSAVSSCESACLVSLERGLLFFAARLKRRSCFLFGPAFESSSLSWSRSTLELSWADEPLPFSSASIRVDTAASIFPFEASNALLMVGLSARNGKQFDTTSICQGCT